MGLRLLLLTQRPVVRLRTAPHMPAEYAAELGVAPEAGILGKLEHGAVACTVAPVNKHVQPEAVAEVGDADAGLALEQPAQLAGANARLPRERPKVLRWV